MSTTTRLMSLVKEAAVPYRVEPHQRAITAQEVAEVAHVRGSEMVKSVIVVTGGRHVMLAVPATARVNIEALRSFLKTDDVRMAEEWEFTRDFPDCEIGAMPPVGNLYNMRLLASDLIKSDEEVAFNAGSHTEVLRMKRADWEKLASPEWGAFAQQQ